MNHESIGNKRPESQEPNFWRTRSGVTLGVLGAIAGFLLISEHQAHFIEALPLLLLGGCIVMHLFMHGGHGGHGGQGRDHQGLGGRAEEEPVPGDSRPIRLSERGKTDRREGEES